MQAINKCLSTVVITVFLMSSAVAEEPYKKFGHGKVVFLPQQITLDVEVATSKMQRTIGLMFREELAENSGMLFVFEREAIQRVWMRYTLIPLDVVFISAQGKIVSMVESMQPCKLEPCEIYESTEVASYMLEVNAGMLSRNKIETGHKLLLFL